MSRFDLLLSKVGGKLFLLCLLTTTRIVVDKVHLDLILVGKWYNTHVHIVHRYGHSHSLEPHPSPPIFPVMSLLRLAKPHQSHTTAEPSLVPDPTLSRGKGSGET